jgi:hypothetical protein
VEYSTVPRYVWHRPAFLRQSISARNTGIVFLHPAVVPPVDDCAIFHQHRTDRNPAFIPAGSRFSYGFLHERIHIFTEVLQDRYFRN